MTAASAREAIAARWLDRILRSYPAEGAEFMASAADRFRNPAGHILREAAGIIVDELLGGMNADRLIPALESIVRIRAVQTFTPARAVGFVLELKEVVRDVHPDLPLDVICSRIDYAVLMAFDAYVKCREKMYEIRVNEARRQAQTLERMLLARSHIEA